MTIGETRYLAWIKANRYLDTQDNRKLWQAAWNQSHDVVKDEVQQLLQKYKNAFMTAAGGVNAA